MSATTNCLHTNAIVSYDAGGDGYTEPGSSWGVYCLDCHNESMSQAEADELIDSHINNKEG